MKVILCTGDSHTCGQYSEGYRTWDGESFGYNYLGDGYHRSMSFEGKAYPNQIRNYILENTATRLEKTDITDWGTEIAGMRKVTQPIALEVCCDMLLFQVGKKKEEAVMNVYLDGELYCRNVLKTDNPKFGIWSFDYVAVPCSGKNKIEIVPEEAPIFISRCEQWTGEYMVVNAGVGSCPMERYRLEFLPTLIEKFKPYAFVAELHTVNDWVKGNTVQAYGEALEKTLQIMKDNSQVVLAVTVPQILRQEPKTYAKDFYVNFVKESYRIIEKTGVIMADAYSAFKEASKGRSTNELLQTLYGDDLHPSQEGNNLYAKVIIKEMKKYL